MSKKQLEDLEKVILFIQNNYNEINNKWQKNDRYKPLNMKRTKVFDVYKSEDLLSYVFSYRNFVGNKSMEFMQKLKFLDIDSSISSRIKALNSIQFKVESYTKYHEEGKIPLKKCLNDLLGIRMIFVEDIDYDCINQFLKEKFPKLKCIDSQKGNYNAVHIYFGNEDNKNFQWELQLWDKKHEKNNYKSHSIYKQDYVKWEKNNI